VFHATVDRGWAVLLFGFVLCGDAVGSPVGQWFPWLFAFDGRGIRR
jgi:hypothetical protein